MMDIHKWSKEFTVEFIELYRSYPCLWRVKSSDYSDRNKRTNAYEKLCSKLQEIDETASKETVVQKVDSFRSHFQKELEKIKDSKRSGAGTDNVYIPKLWYFEKLQFLLDQEIPKNGVSKFSESESNEDSTLINVFQSTIDDIIDELENNSYSTQSQVSKNAVSFDKPTQNKKGKRVKEKKNPCDKLKRISENEFKVVGTNISFSLRGLSNEAKVMSEKIINDIIFQAEECIKTSLQQHSPN